MTSLREVKSGDYALLSNAGDRLGTLLKNRFNRQWRFYMVGRTDFKSFNSVGDCAEWLSEGIDLNVTIDRYLRTESGK